jgi:hypothetical protein
VERSIGKRELHDDRMAGQQLLVECAVGSRPCRNEPNLPRGGQTDPVKIKITLVVVAVVGGELAVERGGIGVDSVKIQHHHDGG